MGTIVEFLGVPGAGKTTLAGGVAQRLRATGLTVHETFEDWNTSRLARLADLAGSFVPVLRWNPSLLVRGWELGSPVAAHPSRDRAKTAMYWVSRSGHYERARRVPGIHLIDQGVLQAYWSLYFAGHGESLDRLRHRLESSRQHADLVVVVSAGEETVLSRLAARPGMTSRLERSLEDPEEAMSRAQAAVDRALGHLEDPASRPRLVKVVNDDDDGRLTAADEVSALLIHPGSGDVLT